MTAVRTVTIALALLLAAGCYFVPLGDLTISCMFAVFAGLFNVPILPSTYGLSTKLVGNMPPAVVNGLMMSGAQLYAFFATLALTAILDIG